MEKVVVIDFGGQYSHLIARRIRELGVFSELVSAAEPEAAKRGVEEAVALVLSGGPASVWEGRHDEIARLAMASGKPLLGICYGHQLLGALLGGRVSRSPRPEFGPTRVSVIKRGDLLEGLPDSFIAWMSHNDAVLEPPPEAEVLATSEGSPVAAMRIGNIYGVQWHPEVAHSEHGMRVLDNWLRAVGARRSWRPLAAAEEAIREMARSIEGVAIAAVSGGVDSTVAALLAKRAIGDRLVAIMIDHGLHPLGEPKRSAELLERVGLKVKIVDASDRFLAALEGVRDPEEKRRVFGRAYAEVLEEEAKKVGARYLVQGTIYPDVIESGGRPGASVIKTHHNVGGLPQSLGLALVEPLRWLYKDEVREIARSLGLPEEIVSRQPIPGPALAVRVEGEVTREKIEIVRRADAIVREEIERAGAHRGLWQYFAVLLSSKATGVKGDNRAYGHVIAIRAVESSDAMTASVARLSWDLLERIAQRIVSEVAGVTRVVYDITSKPPATIEWE